jgi:hypothetical protein
MALQQAVGRDKAEAAERIVLSELVPAATAADVEATTAATTSRVREAAYDRAQAELGELG